MSLLSLDDGNQDELKLAPTVSREALDQIASKYKWSRFDEYDNRMWQYMYALHDPVWKTTGAAKYGTLWPKLTRPQKVFFAYLAFNGETDNGGVWQFLFNCPELSIAALEAMDTIRAERLASDYRATLEQVLGKARSIIDLRRRANQKGLSFEKKWSAFAEGYQELPSTTTIEDYFYSKKYKKEIYRQMCDYIEEHVALFANIELSQETA